MVHLQIMKLEIKEIDGVPVTGSPGRTGTTLRVCWSMVLSNLSIRASEKKEKNLINPLPAPCTANASVSTEHSVHSKG